jgi:hypothetical protein
LTFFKLFQQPTEIYLPTYRIFSWIKFLAFPYKLTQVGINIAVSLIFNLHFNTDDRLGFQFLCAVIATGIFKWNFNFSNQISEIITRNRVFLNQSIIQQCGIVGDLVEIELCLAFIRGNPIFITAAEHIETQLGENFPELKDVAFKCLQIFFEDLLNGM